MMEILTEINGEPVIICEEGDTPAEIEKAVRDAAENGDPLVLDYVCLLFYDRRFNGIEAYELYLCRNHDRDAPGDEIWWIVWSYEGYSISETVRSPGEIIEKIFEQEGADNHPARIAEAVARLVEVFGSAELFGREVTEEDLPIIVDIERKRWWPEHALECLDENPIPDGTGVTYKRYRTGDAGEIIRIYRSIWQGAPDYWIGDGEEED